MATREIAVTFEDGSRVVVKSAASTAAAFKADVQKQTGKAVLTLYYEDEEETLEDASSITAD